MAHQLLSWIVELRSWGISRFGGLPFCPPLRSTDILWSSSATISHIVLGGIKGALVVVVVVGRGGYTDIIYPALPLIFQTSTCQGCLDKMRTQTIVRKSLFWDIYLPPLRCVYVCSPAFAHFHVHLSAVAAARAFFSLVFLCCLGIQELESDQEGGPPADQPAVQSNGGSELTIPLFCFSALFYSTNLFSPTRLSHVVSHSANSRA